MLLDERPKQARLGAQEIFIRVMPAPDIQNEQRHRHPYRETHLKTLRREAH